MILSRAAARVAKDQYLPGWRGGAVFVPGKYAWDAKGTIGFVLISINAYDRSDCLN